MVKFDGSILIKAVIIKPNHTLNWFSHTTAAAAITMATTTTTITATTKTTTIRESESVTH